MCLASVCINLELFIILIGKNNDLLGVRYHPPTLYYNFELLLFLVANINSRNPAGCHRKFGTLNTKLSFSVIKYPSQLQDIPALIFIVQNISCL